MANYLACLVFILATNPVLAQDWDLRDMDIPLGLAGAQALTAGSTLTLPDDGRSKFSVGGAYSHTFADDGVTTFGMFSIESDGRVCIDFRDGVRRCNLYVRSGGLLMMLSETGERFPVRVQLTLRP